MYINRIKGINEKEKKSLNNRLSNTLFYNN